MASEPKSDLAETAALLLNSNSTATLATVSVKHDGFPFASQAPYSVIQNVPDPGAKMGVPIFLFSNLSVHSKNLRNNSKATLLVQAGNSAQQSRISLMGNIGRLGEDKIDEARQSYLIQHPNAAQWTSFGDFNFYALSIVDCYVVAGFGKAGWVKQ